MRSIIYFGNILHYYAISFQYTLLLYTIYLGCTTYMRDGCIGRALVSCAKDRRFFNPNRVKPMTYKK